MKTLKFILQSSILFVFITCLSSCGRTPFTPDPYIVSDSRQKENLYYVPKASNTQLLTKKNDLGFNILSSAAPKFTGVEIQSSYIPAKHLGIISSYSYAHNSTMMKYHSIELGVGYIKELSNGWHFEVYGGFGNGNIFNEHHTGTSNINLRNYFIQPAITITNQNKSIQLGFISKLNAVNFKIDTTFNNEREPFNTNQAKSLYEHPNHIIWEPGFIFRAGLKNLLFHSSYTFSYDITNTDLYKANGNFSMGLALRLNLNKKNQQQK